MTPKDNQSWAEALGPRINPPYRPARRPPWIHVQPPVESRRDFFGFESASNSASWPALGKNPDTRNEGLKRIVDTAQECSDAALEAPQTAPDIFRCRAITFKNPWKQSKRNYHTTRHNDEESLSPRSMTTIRPYFPLVPEAVPEAMLIHQRLSYREFPSLSGGPPQSQLQGGTSQPIWNGQSIRGASTSATVQRPQPQLSSDPPSSGVPPLGNQQQRSEQQENVPSTQFGSSAPGYDEIGFGEPGRPRRRSTQQGSGDDFPPLGGLGDPEGRHNSSHQARFDGLGNGIGYGGPPGPGRSSMLGQGEAHLDGLAAPGARVMSPSDINPNGELCDLPVCCVAR